MSSPIANNKHKRLNMCVHKIARLADFEIDDFVDNCEYEPSGKRLLTSRGDMKILHHNIRGLNSKLEELKRLMKTTLNPDLILLSETWLKNHSPRPYLPGYKLERSDRMNKKGGGVCIFLTDSCKYKRRPDLEKMNCESLESCFVEIETPITKLISGSIYRPPNTNPDEFTRKLSNIIALAKETTKNITIGLDHNLDLLKCDKHGPTQDFVEMLYEHNMIPTITKPTRITTSSATLIDNIIINLELSDSTTSGILEENISDHLPCYNIISGMYIKKKKPQMVMSRDMRPKRIAALKKKLEDHPDLLLPHNGPVNSQFEEFHDKLLKEINHFLPERTRRIKMQQLRHEPWVSPGLLISIKKCKKLYRTHLRNRNCKKTYDKYVAYNTKLKKVKRHAKKHYYEDQCIEHKNNTKNLWKTINKVVRKTNNKTETVEALKIKNLRSTNGNEIVNEFARYFSTVGEKLANNMPQPHCDVNSYISKVARNPKSIYLTPVSPAEVHKLICKLKPKLSSGVDDINNKLLKELNDYISGPLAQIINRSLTDGIFPEKMKQAKVVPLFKSKEREHTTNYRPISLLLTISKILEKVVYSRVYKFLSTTEQLYVSQYGFRKSHSCEHAVGELIANITKGIENGKLTAGIFLDLSKAFDTLEHDVVYKKLELYGLRGVCLDWFKSYLNNRSMLVECKAGETGATYTSESHSVRFGTPQGSCLGPLIFLIFCNDLQKHLMFLSCIQFADDTTLYITHTKLDYIRFCIETDLNTLQDWFLANKLTLNVGKSVCILFGQRHTCTEPLNISLGTENIPQCKSTKFLGMWIDESLNWNEHVTKIILKLKSRLNLLKVGKNLLSQHALRVMYFAQLHSVMTYGIVMWGGLTSQCNLNKIQKIQNACVRIIERQRCASQKSSFSNLRILSVSQTIDLELQKLWHKYQLGLLPPGLKEIMSSDHKRQTLLKDHRYNTRRKNLNNIPLAKHAKYQNSFLVEGFRKYSQLPVELQETQTYTHFCKRAKDAILSKS